MKIKGWAEYRPTDIEKGSLVIAYGPVVSTERQDEMLLNRFEEKKGEIDIYESALKELAKEHKISRDYAEIKYFDELRPFMPTTSESEPDMYMLTLGRLMSPEDLLSISDEIEVSTERQDIDASLFEGSIYVPEMFMEAKQKLRDYLTEQLGIKFLKRKHWDVDILDRIEITWQPILENRS